MDLNSNLIDRYGHTINSLASRRWTLIEGIVDLGEIAAHTIPIFIEILHDKNADFRLFVVQSVQKIGESSTSVLIEALCDKDPNVRMAARQGLESIGIPPLSRLTEVIHHPDTKVRQEVLFLLGKLGVSAIPALITALGDTDYSVRGTAGWVLNEIKSPDTDTLISALIDIDRYVYSLMDALHDKDPDVRVGTIKVLGWIKTFAAPAVPMLIELLSDTETGFFEPVCNVTVQTLEEIATPEALEAVHQWWERK